mgnify:CR=1 FL=1
MFNNIFRKYDFDNLYIGVVTVYRNKNKKPSCVKVDVPPDLEKVSYVTILSKLNNGAYLQIDNDQCCFYFGQKYMDYSNFPVVSNLISLRDYYKYYQNKKNFVVKPNIGRFRQKRIIEDVKEKAMVI